MIIRKLRSDENHKVAKVSSIAFNYTTDLEKAKEDALDEEFIGAFEDDGETIMAHVAVIDYKSYFCGCAVGAVGIAGVATLPEYRRAGSIRAIINEIFKMSESRGWDVSFLYPFSYRYYRKFGYERVVRVKTLTTKLSALGHIPRCFDVTLYDSTEKLEKLLELYNSFASQNDVTFKRENGKYFSAKPNASGKYTYIYFDAKGEYRAYVMFTVAGRRIDVSELVYLDKDALLGILGFLRSYEGQLDDITFGNLPEDSPLEYLLDSDRMTSYGLYDGAMGRVINIPKILKLNDYPSGQGKFSIKIDDCIAENKAVYAVEYSESGVTVEKKDFSEFAQVECSAASFSRMVLGEASKKEFSYLPDVVINDSDTAFFRCFSKRSPILFERF